MSPPERRGPPPAARILGYSGLIRFVGLALATWFLAVIDPALAAAALLAYGATIASFLGAIHWGLALREASGPGLYAWGVVPALIAWVALMLPTAQGLALTTAILWACFAVDRAVYPRFGLQAWLPLRLTLTVVASVSCLAVAAGRIAATA